MKPMVSVIMPVYNGSKHLRAAIESILNQSYGNFEFLIVDDGSKDESVSIIKEYTDERIQLIVHEKNMGLLRTLNSTFEIAKGKYIARMDQDDISVSARLNRQVQFMESNEEVGLCGSWIQVFGLGNYIHKYATGYDEIKAALLFENAFAHPSVMIRKELFFRENLRYEKEFLHIDDYDLWVRAAKRFPVDNLPEVLVHYRTSEESYCRMFSKEQQMALQKLDRRSLLGLNLKGTDEEIKSMKALREAAKVDTIQQAERVISFCTVLIKANLRAGQYPASCFERKVSELCMRFCRRNEHLGMEIWKLTRKADIRDVLKNELRFFWRCAIGEGRNFIEKRRFRT